MFRNLDDIIARLDQQDKEIAELKKDLDKSGRIMQVLGVTEDQAVDKLLKTLPRGWTLNERQNVERSTYITTHFVSYYIEGPGGIEYEENKSRLNAVLIACEKVRKAEELLGCNKSKNKKK